MKIVVATEKPFSSKAVEGIKKIVEEANHTFALLEKYTDIRELKDAVKDAEALIIRSDKITKDVMEAAPNLKIVVRAGAGYDNVDCLEAKNRGIVVMNTPGQNSNAVAELAIGMMIYMVRNQFTPGTGTEIKGKKLGIHAFGNVGRIVARYGKAFGMEVFAFDPFITDDAIYEADDVTPVSCAEELYKKCDFVSIHIPATAQTKGSINRALLSLLPKRAVVVNTARKEIINEADLLSLMAERTDIKYATDVRPDNFEELSKQSDKRVFATPKKIGAETAEANLNAGLAAAYQIVDFFSSNNRKFQVNK